MTEPSEPIRIVYFGTPEYAVPTLTGLAGAPAFDVVLVVSQPGRPAGRGRAVAHPPVRREADRLALPCLQPETLADATVRHALSACDADLFVVAAFGRIFGKVILGMPRHGCLNLHASLLPRYRGASPVTAAILNGDTETGVSLMVMEAGLDTGPVAAAARCPIVPSDTTGSLTIRLASISAALAVETIADFVGGARKPVPQPKQGATIVRQLVKADGWIDWSLDVDSIAGRTRAMLPWPRAWTTLPTGESIQILEAIVGSPGPALTTGQVDILDRTVLIGCGRGALELRSVQLPGGKAQSAIAAIAGRKLVPGTVLGVSGQPAQPPPYERVVTPLV